jgi:Cu(I)/Ag(I) efflux system membrane fusion protein
MKKNFRYIKYILYIIFLLLAVISCDKSKKTHTDEMHIDNSMQMHGAKYYCPMHPEIVSDKPGICPKCDMDLELIPNEKSVDTLATLIQPTNRIVVSSLKPIATSLNKGYARIGTLGYLTYNPDYVNAISARVSGRIEKLYVKYNFEKVSKGQKLLDIYSSELLTAQNEYLYLIESKDTDSKNAVREKLFNLGMNENALNILEKTKQVSPYVSVYTTSSGHVHFLSGNTNMSSHALTWPGNNTSNSMNEAASDNSETLREGDYVKKGDPLFTIADGTSIWALFKILPNDISKIHTGESVDVIINNKTYSGKINFIEKSFDTDEDFYTARVYLSCHDHTDLKIGTLIRGYISVSNKKTNTLWIPTTATLNLGKSSYAVFIKKGIAYEASEIKTGTQTSEWIEVVSGLNASDSIAPVASYLVDSEAFISIAK